MKNVDAAVIYKKGIVLMFTFACEMLLKTTVRSLPVLKMYACEMSP